MRIRIWALFELVIAQCFVNTLFKFIIPRELFSLFVEKVYPKIEHITEIKGLLNKEIFVEQNVLKYQKSQLYLAELDDFILF